MILDFIEIGTSDFETLIENCENQTGLSIDAVDLYLERLPNKPNVIKLNYAISNFTGEVEVFYVHPDDIEKNNLSWYLKGCNTIGEPHSVTLRELKEKKLENLLQIKKVPVLSWKDLIERHNIEQVKLLKIDAEGHDIVIVRNILEGGHNVYPETIVFEANELTSDKDRTEIINFAIEKGYEFVDYNAKKDVILKRKKGPKILLINNWFGEIPDFYKFHEKTMQFQNENIDIFLFTDQEIKSQGLSKNYHICKVSEDNIKYRFYNKTGRKYTGTIVGKTTIMKLMFLDNFFEDILNYSKYDYVGIYDTDTLFNDIYEWVKPYLDKKDFISVGGGKNHDRLSGPLCLFRNTKEVLKLFSSDEYYESVVNENVNYLEHNVDEYAKSLDSVEIIQYTQNVEHETSKIIFEAEWSGGKLYCNNKEILVHHFYRKKDTQLNFIGNTIVSKFKKHFENDFYWVTSFDQKYESHVLSLIETIEKFSHRKCLLFPVNYDPNFKYKLSEQFIVRRVDIPEGKKDSKGRDYNFLVFKPLIDLECLKIIPDGLFVHIDTDVLLTITCDDIKSNFSKLENYPLFNSHTHDELIIPTGIDDKWVNPIRILAEQTGDPIRVYPRRKSNIYVFDKKSKWFFEEQMNIFKKYYETVPHILHFHDEDTANIILNRFDFRNSLPLVDMEESDKIDLSKFENYSYSFGNPLSPNLILPKTENDILMFHGIKDIQKQSQVTEKYFKTVLCYDDIITYVKDDKVWFEKNSTLGDKLIGKILNFSIYKGDVLMGELNNQNIYDFWFFYIGGLTFTEGTYTCYIKENSNNRIVFRKMFGIK